MDDFGIFLQSSSSWSPFGPEVFSTTPVLLNLFTLVLPCKIAFGVVVGLGHCKGDEGMEWALCVQKLGSR